MEGSSNFQGHTPGPPILSWCLLAKSNSSLVSQDLPPAPAPRSGWGPPTGSAPTGTAGCGGGGARVTSIPPPPPPPPATVLSCFYRLSLSVVAQARKAIGEPESTESPSLVLQTPFLSLDRSLPSHPVHLPPKSWSQPLRGAGSQLVMPAKHRGFEGSNPGSRGPRWAQGLTVSPVPRGQGVETWPFSTGSKPSAATHPPLAGYSPRASRRAFFSNPCRAMRHEARSRCPCLLAVTGLVASPARQQEHAAKEEGSAQTPGSGRGGGRPRLVSWAAPSCLPAFWGPAGAHGAGCLGRTSPAVHSADSQPCLTAHSSVARKCSRVKAQLPQRRAPDKGLTVLTSHFGRAFRPACCQGGSNTGQ